VFHYRDPKGLQKLLVEVVEDGVLGVDFIADVDSADVWLD